MIKLIQSGCHLKDERESSRTKENVDYSEKGEILEMYVTRKHLRFK